MAKKLIEKEVLIYICERCNYEWESRLKLKEGLPISCPNCKSRYWNKKRKNERTKQNQKTMV